MTHLKTFTATMVAGFLLILGNSSAWGKTPDLAYVNEDQARILLAHDGYVHINVFYCGHCPNSRSKVLGTMKDLQAAIDRQQLPAIVRLITPDFTPEELADFAKSNDMETVIFAQDRANALDISLKNIWQLRIIHKGKRFRFGLSADELTAAIEELGAEYRFPVDGLENPRAKELWWMIERAEPGSLELLAQATTRRNPLQEDAKRIRAVVEPAYREREAQLVAAPATIDTFEGLEQLISEAGALGLEAAEKRYQELGKDRELRDEITARKAYQRIHDKLLSHNSRKKREMAPAAFQQLAERFPDTKYGKLAAER